MENMVIRSFKERDIDAILKLNEKEGWDRLTNKEDTFHALNNSEPALVACIDEDIVGYLRGITDGIVTLYISEILVRQEERGKGISRALMEEAHRCFPSTRVEVLANADTEQYYKSQGFRSFFGFRKASKEFKPI
ncbi:GNAT family N-acetyltransferase [Halobacillus massiliensis]|uniref:GNAT family N-acetyltransferase n=1 Tax=Halobacillus massiliensis TaxID=1926286 RepID=UPI0009E25557|nr:GNAT family N-acetyltransferase [Halobacillus massiliensis]